MRIFQFVRNFKEKQSQRLYEEAIKEQAESFQLSAFEEHFSPDEVKPVVLKNELFSGKKPASRKFSRHLKERRASTVKQFSNITMVRSPWRYDRIDAFYRRESYFSRSIIRQIETMMRNKYSFTSVDPKLLSIIKREFYRIQMDSKIPINRFLFSAAKQLLKYGIAIVQKVRERVKDDIALDDKRKNRITMLRLINPHNAIFYINNTGRLIGVEDGSNSFIALRLKQLIKRNTSFGIPADDIMIMYMDAPGDELFPEPPCFQMLDDILTLRSIEETIELIAFQYGSPLLHARVGTDELPATPEEVRGVNAELISMSPNGMVTTDHRTTIDTVNMQKGVTNLIPYLEHFKNRVLTGSGSSPLGIGYAESANRNTAESIDDALADHCTNLADAITEPINCDLIPDLIVRSKAPYSYPDLFTDEGELKVQIMFNETRLDKKIAQTNDVINQWEANLITHPEARKKLHRTPDVDERLLYVNMVQIPLKQAGKGQADERSDTTVSNMTRVQNQPQNQHGTKPGPGSRKDKHYN